MCSKGELQQKKLLNKIQERKKMFKDKKNTLKMHTTTAWHPLGFRVLCLRAGISAVRACGTNPCFQRRIVV